MQPVGKFQLKLLVEAGWLLLLCELKNLGQEETVPGYFNISFWVVVSYFYIFAYYTILKTLLDSTWDVYHPLVPLIYIQFPRVHRLFTSSSGFNDFARESDADELLLETLAREGGGFISEDVVKGMRLHAATKCLFRGRDARGGRIGEVGFVRLHDVSCKTRLYVGRFLAKTSG